MARASLVMGLCLIAGAAHGQTLAFSDRTAEAGIDASYTPIETTVPTQPMLAGGAVGDFNRDGWPDLIILSGGPEPDRLYINNADGTFTDRAAEWGVARAHVGAGVAVGDYNADGFTDLYVLGLGAPDEAPAVGAHLLYRNNADGTFTEVAAQAGVDRTGVFPSGTGAAFGDYDLDGDLDLLAAGWMDGALGNRLFRNNDDGTFTDATDALRGADLGDVRGFTPAIADMDGDRHPELLITGDFQSSAYFVNNRDGTFTHVPRDQAGITDDCFAMGAVVADLNADGWLDWSISNIIEPELPQSPYAGCGQVLYLNQGGAHRYVDAAPEAGVEDGHWGWGLDAADFNNDGHPDLAGTNGWWGRTFERDPTMLWLNNADGTFTEVGAALGFDDRGQGRGLVTLDYDRDGDVDIVVLNHDGPARLFRNDLAGPAIGFLRIRLDTSGRPDLAPDGFGASIELTAGGATQHRYVDGAPTYLGVSELTEHVGLGAAEIVDEVRVTWPDATETVLRDIQPDQEIVIRPPPSCAHADADGDGLPDWGMFDVNADGVVDLDDLYAIHRADADVNADGRIDPSDAACLEAFLRRGEAADMTAGRR